MEEKKVKDVDRAPSLTPSESSDKNLQPLQDSKPNRTLLQTIIHYVMEMRMEPGFLIYMTASVMGNIMASDLQLDRACRNNVGYNESVCDVLMQTGKKPAAYEEYEREVQRVISSINVWSEFVENLIPIFYSLFLGTWLDVYGCKAPMLLSIFGVMLRYGGLLLCTYMDGWNAQLVAVFGIIPGSFTGGRIAVSMVVYSYVTITSSLSERTVRVGILTAIRTFGRSAGSSLGGYMKRTGRDYYFIFGIGGGLAAVSFIYILLIMPNPKRGNNPLGFKTDSKVAAIKNLFNPKNIWEAAKEFFKWRPYGIRTQLLTLVAILIFTMAPMQGEDSVLLLFVRNKIKWDTASYAEYGTFRMLVAFAGGVASVGLLVTWLKISDWKLGVASCISQIAGSIVYAFATKTNKLMYIAPFVDILNGTMIIASRAMISKIFPIQIMGKINSIVAVIDSTTPLWGNPVYNGIYNQTLDDFPGAFFIFSAALTIPPLFLFTYMGLKKQGLPIEEQAARHERKYQHIENGKSQTLN